MERGEESLPTLSSGPVRAADGTRNADIGYSPCSVGAAINGGFLTAGHCGYAGEEVYSPSLIFMGPYAASTFPFPASTFHDSAWVETVAGWIPEPTINGYASGVLTVPSTWSGISQAPVGSTVCRYGQTSEGPHCGIVDQVDHDWALKGAGFTIVALDTTRVAGACTDDGDSGGPYVAAGSGQLQGTNIGGRPVNTCPAMATYVYFQPMPIHQQYWLGKNVLTAHGALPPTVSGMSCPNMGSSGSGQYQCDFSHYNSQGPTSISWTSSEGHASTSAILWGSCSPGFPLDVPLAITNPYGTYNYSKTFICPTGIIP